MKRIFYGLVFANSDEGNKFAFFTEAMNDLKLTLSWPTGEFFGIKNFPIDWPVVSKWPTPTFSVGSVITYLSIIGYVYVGFIILTSTLRFISRLKRSKVKSIEVFSKSLDDFSVNGDEVNGEK